MVRVVGLILVGYIRLYRKGNVFFIFMVFFWMKGKLYLNLVFKIIMLMLLSFVLLINIVLFFVNFFMFVIIFILFKRIWFGKLLLMVIVFLLNFVLGERLYLE